MDFPSKLLRAQKELSDQQVKGQESGEGGQRKQTRGKKQRGRERERESELLPNMSQFPTTIPTHSSAAPALDVTWLFGLNEARSFPNHNKHIQSLGPAQLKPVTELQSGGGKPKLRAHNKTSVSKQMLWVFLADIKKNPTILEIIF